MRLLIAACFTFLGLLYFSFPAFAVEDVPGDSCAGITADSFRWAGGPENGGAVNGLFCESNTWKGAIYFQSSGKVGIGTTAPASLLQINHQAWAYDKFNQGELVLYNGSGGTYTIRASDAGDNAAFQLQSAANAGNGAQIFLAASGNAAGSVMLLDYGSSNAAPAGNFQIRSRSNSGGVTTRFEIDQNGKVGIGTTSPAAALHVVGDIRYTGVIVDISDRRAKKDIRPLPTGQLAKMMQLQPVSFVMKDDPKGRTELGLIAQDTEPLYPDLVQTDPDGSKSLGYVGLVAPLIKAMQEQQAEIDHLRAGLAVVFCIALVPGFLLWRNRAK